MRFTLRQLSYFVAAGETGSVTRAAEHVNISQPSVSAAISHLETELGVQLFVRHHAQGLSLTPAGTRLLRAAKGTLHNAFELYDVANETKGTVSGPINVGAFTTFAPLILPELWRGFVHRFADVQMNVTEGSEFELLDLLRHARIDIALTYGLHVTDDITFAPLATLPTYALVSADHRLAGKQSVRLAELAEDPFILLDLALSREYFLGLFKKLGLQPRIVAETPNSATLRSYVGCGIGFSLMTTCPVSKTASNGRRLDYIALEDDLEPMVIGLATLKDLRKTRVVEMFEAHCRTEITTDHLPGMLTLQKT